MKLRFNLLLALTSLRHHRLRSVLAILGVVIGVAAVIAVVSIGEANHKRIAAEVEHLGADLFWVHPNYERAASRMQPSSGIRPSPSPELKRLQRADLFSLQAFCPQIKNLAAVKQYGTRVIWRGREHQLTCVATSPSYLETRQIRLLAGRFLHALDDSLRQRVVVLEYSSPLKASFASGMILGEVLWINDVRFTVVGVVESKGELSHAFGGGVLYLPHSALSYLKVEDKSFDMIYCRVASRTNLETTMRQARRILRSRHTGENYFEASNARTLYRSAENLTRTATLVATAIAAIALLVGGIGVMNLMLVTVSERTHEIGIQRAVGAKRRDIALQFFAEAILLCITGGLLGILLGVITGKVIAQGWQLEGEFSSAAALIGSLFSCSVGIAAGLFPAYKASQLSPLAALRRE